MKAPERMPTRWAELIDAARTLDCIHCGLCLDTCPTFQLTGRESASPRGRVHLMRAAGEGRLVPDADFADEMNGCLVCRRCESVCPAGVEFGPMMGRTRGALELEQPPSGRRKLLRWLGFRVLLSRRWALRLAAHLVRIGQRTGLDELTARFLPEGFPAPADAPRVPSRHARRRLEPPQPEAPAESAWLLEGCVMPILFGPENRATAASLAERGVQARVARKVACCGSLAAHNGDLENARELAKRMIEEHPGEDPVVVNSAGCSSHMAELEELFEQDDPWHARALAFAKRVVDFSSFVAARHATPQPSPLLADARRVTFDDPCHLCHGMGVREAPRQVLDALIAGENARRNAGAQLTRVELDDSEACCGSAGIYSLLEPAASRELLEAKLDALQATGADLLVTANPGCQLQWQSGIERRGLAVRVAHLASLTSPAT